MIIKNIFDNLGNTPTINIDWLQKGHINLFLKLESFNPTGSIKDRAASYVLTKSLAKNYINTETKLVESSSGNFGISLSATSRLFDLFFICVIDPLISPEAEKMIRILNSNVVKVNSGENVGGYLTKRIETVKQILNETPNSYWINQYSNPLNAEAYYYSLGQEIENSFEGKIDFLFVPVSSGGTITGVSNRVKEKNKATQVVAVDVEGSIIFGGQPKKRLISGIGANKVPSILKQAQIDEVVIVTEEESITNCHYLLRQYCIFSGGSSGAVMSAINQFFLNKTFKKTPNVLAILPDRGDRYYSTIYNPEWIFHNFTALRSQ